MVLLHTYTHRISTSHTGGAVYRFIEYILYTQFLVANTYRISSGNRFKEYILHTVPCRLDLYQCFVSVFTESGYRFW
jgi:hypothetical protein